MPALRACEYDQFKQVYFPNELALTMYREAGADFAVLKKISADELPIYSALH